MERAAGGICKECRRGSREVFCTVAAGNGHLSCLIASHERGYAWGADTCAAAARNGRLACLRYAHERGCPLESNAEELKTSGRWTACSCVSAAAGGHLDCLRYAHECGCPLTPLVLTYAEEQNHVSCVVYALTNHCPREICAAWRDPKSAWPPCPHAGCDLAWMHEVVLEVESRTRDQRSPGAAGAEAKAEADSESEADA